MELAQNWFYPQYMIYDAILIYSQKELQELDWLGPMGQYLDWSGQLLDRLGQYSNASVNI